MTNAVALETAQRLACVIMVGMECKHLTVEFGRFAQFSKLLKHHRKAKYCVEMTGVQRKIS